MSDSIFIAQDQAADFWGRVVARAKDIKDGVFLPGPELQSKKVGLLFFEPSSRTRWSFEKACLDLGVPNMVSVVDGSTSLSKGELSQDTLELYINLGFDLIVMRSGGDRVLREIAEASSVPFINAGFGVEAHPTQALLDYFTWTYDWHKPVEKVLIMGDLKHSRVARSHIRMAKVFGYKVGLLSPASFSIESGELEALGEAQVFADRREALAWADVVMSLRVQKERHQSGARTEDFAPLSVSEVREDQAVMHPGPFMRDEDLETALIKDRRSLIFKQKRNGVYCRSALLSCMLEKQK